MIKICHLSEIPDPGCKEFSISADVGVNSGFLVHLNQELSAFINSCPHTGVSLNWSPDQFLDVAAEYIQCTMHGARFRPNDGYCVWGPCRGASLQRLSVKIEGNYIYVKV